MPTRAPAVTSPLAVDRSRSGSHSDTARAAPGCSGTLVAPASPRITSSGPNSAAVASPIQPSAPVSAAQNPRPSPIAVIAHRGPTRSISHPPGSMPSVYTSRNAEYTSPICSSDSLPGPMKWALPATEMLTRLKWARKVNPVSSSTTIQRTFVGRGGGVVMAATGGGSG